MGIAIEKLLPQWFSTLITHQYHQRTILKSWWWGHSTGQVTQNYGSEDPDMK
jgi:hypothetical protein